MNRRIHHRSCGLKSPGVCEFTVVGPINKAIWASPFTNKICQFWRDTINYCEDHPLLRQKMSRWDKYLANRKRVKELPKGIKVTLSGLIEKGPIRKVGSFIMFRFKRRMVAVNASNPSQRHSSFEVKSINGRHGTRQMVSLGLKL